VNPYSALWSVVSHRNGLHLIDWQDGSRREQTWIDAGDAERFSRMLTHHVEHNHDPRVSLVPRRDKHPDGIGPSRCVWVSVENKVSARALEAFRPLPTLRFGQGSKQVAIWWLDGALPMTADPSTDWVTRANKRLAFALKGNSRHGDPEWLMPVRPLLDARPVSFEPSVVVGRLRDAPVRSVPGRKLSAA
jgi:hypothetical protein